MRVAIGIPFLATAHDAALRLCLLSLERYAGLEYDLFLQIDVRNPVLAAKFDLERLVRRHPRMCVRRYKSRAMSSWKQDLVDWVTTQDGYDAVFILHADVFLHRGGLLPEMLGSMVDGGCMASFWTVPLLEAGLPFAAEAAKRRPRLVAPRIGTWLFCLDCAAYRKLAKRFAFSAGLFRGHDIFDLGMTEHPFVAWVRGQPEFAAVEGKYKSVFCDNGTYFRYVTDKLRLPCHSMGTDGHPVFATRDLVYRPEGFVHIEQFTPIRFRTTYPEGMFAERERLVLRVLEDDYGETE